MPLPIKSAAEILNDQVTAMQTQAGVNLDFTVGSDFRALIEANMGNSLWLQALITALLAVTRLSTSSGNDVDTFVGQFGLTRIPAVPSSGPVTFSRFTFTMVANIPVGTVVYSTANQVSYAVYADPTNSYYNGLLNAYVIPADTQAIQVPVIALTAGLVGNLLANQINTISSVLVNVDTVTNASAFVNGLDPESDSSLKQRFVLYLASLSRATLQAIEFAVSSVIGVVRYIVVENENLSNVTQLGYFYVVIDDGTGNASSQLIANVAASVEQYRGLTIAYSINAPVPLPINITAHVFTDGSVPDSTVQEEVITSLSAYILSQGFQTLFAYSRIPALIYGSDSSITDVTSYTLNSGTSDIQLTDAQIMTVGTLTIVMNA